MKKSFDTVEYNPNNIGSWLRTAVFIAFVVMVGLTTMKDTSWTFSGIVKKFMEAVPTKKN